MICNQAFRKLTNHVSRNVIFSFSERLGLHCVYFVENTLWKNLVGKQMFEIGLKANESRFSGMRLFRFQNV